ncbi:conserved hypothetical protein [Parafrankia sp. Ea1.12]|nr:conserved hypothetical protein [Parafrankia sp. Ea1.12]
MSRTRRLAASRRTRPAPGTPRIPWELPASPANQVDWAGDKWGIGNYVPPGGGTTAASGPARAGAAGGVARVGRAARSHDSGD